ncbi:MAG: DnaJ domain-containing protein [Kofleriaceae bacterium]|nr:DnaJ domain-containing protein [Kofleriaceae bacterium]
MAELARGTVLDRPWGRTLAALGLRGLTGQLTVTEGAKVYQIAFHQGAVVAATSPLASDAAVRIAMTLGLVSSTTVTDVAKKQAAQPVAAAQEDDVGALAERSRMQPDQAMRLRRRAIAQRAARTFSVESGEFVVEDRVTLPLVAGAAVDIRTVVFLGAKSLISAGRLDRELGQLGAWFQLKPEAQEDLRQFGFGEVERTLLEPLTAGAGLAELEATGADQRVVRAVVYALVACNACNVEMTARSPAPPRRTPSTTAAPHRKHTPTADLPVRQATPPTGAPTIRQATPLTGAPTLRTQRPTQAPHTEEPPLDLEASIQPTPTSYLDAPTVARPGPPPPSSLDAPTVARPGPPPPSSLDAPTARGHKRSTAPTTRAGEAAAREIESLIKTRMALVEARADHFALLGVPHDASAGQVRSAYLTLARLLHPDRLIALGVLDEERRAQRLFAEVNTAFAVLSDTKRRDEYLAILARGGEDAIRNEQAEAEAMTQRVLESEEAFRKGEQALRRDQIQTAIRELEHAVSLNPDEADYQAALAWARFAGATDKASIAVATRQALEKAIARSPKAAAPKFYLGRVERMLGRDHDAIARFQEVLKLSPGHAEAASELRVLEAKLAQPDKSGSGLFGRFKR